MANEYKFLDEAGLLAFSKEIIKNVKSGDGNKVEASNLIVTSVNDSSDDNHVASAKALNTLIKNTKAEASRYTDRMKSDIETILAQKANVSDVYTKRETDDRIKGIINSAPEALDTLKELSDALGNDANFAATMTAELAKKIDTGHAVTRTDYNIDKLRWGADRDSILYKLDRKVNTSDYNTDKTSIDSDLVYLRNRIKSKAERDGFDFAKNFSLYGGEEHSLLTKEIIDKPDYPQSYMGSINFGTQIGLPGNFVKILYIPHASDGYGTQIAICYDGGMYYGIRYRNGYQKQWKDWVELIDSRRANGHEGYIGTTAPDNDANKCLVSGRPVYCNHNVTQHLPFGTIDDGILIPYIHRIDTIYGFQIFMTWNSNSIWWRRCHGNNWDRWYCIGGGSWDQEVEKDSPQVMKYMRWENYGKNHVIFDASKSLTPSGRACNNTNPEVVWVPTYPTIMGWNGAQTFGVRVDSARTADCVQGFPFRNNNGSLEVLINNAWVKVGGGGGGMQYTVTRQGNATNQEFNYSGGPGVIRAIYGYCIASDFTNTTNGLLTLIVDGVSIRPYFIKVYGGDVHNRYVITNHEIEFKNSVTIRNSYGNYMSFNSLEFIIQTAN